MTRLPLYQVDAFSHRLFGGNPAAVCPLERWLPDDLLQSIAEENNLAETAFLVPRDDGFHLRWFTPRQEVGLCGHATLAAALVVFAELSPARRSVRFATRSGALFVERDGDRLSMDLPALTLTPCPDPPTDLAPALGAAPREVLRCEEDPNLFALYDREQEVRELRPDLVRLESLHPFGVAVSAPGEEPDLVSRFFAPSYGIPEDAATGSIHCALVPYWAGRWGKSRLHARQLSRRGADLYCEAMGDRVRISGHAVLYLEGWIRL